MCSLSTVCHHHITSQYTILSILSHGALLTFNHHFDGSPRSSLCSLKCLDSLLKLEPEEERCQVGCYNPNMRSNNLCHLQMIALIQNL